jgi:DNA/RNA endonuclease YhcR with UshA esterase domain
MSRSFRKAVSGCVLLLGLSATPQQVRAEDQIEALRAPFHVGKSVLSCGKVAQVTTRTDVTYINLDRPYPNHTLGLVIWQRNLSDYESRFGNLASLEGKRVCARGVIEEYRNRLQIIMRNPQFLRLMN